MTNMASLHSTLSNVLTSGKVLLPESEEYKSSNSTYFTAWANDTKPSHIVTPNSVQEVSELVKALNPLLGNGELQMAVRGGGHTPSGSGNIENGVTLNLQGLKGISLNEDKGVVTLGVGETWTSVYSELEKYGLTTAGGRVGRVGVPGFVLGGGLSLYSTSRGFSCDSVVDWEVVLASGEVVHANAKDNSDLYLALKGGLNNFGVVTSFQMKTFKAGPVWGGGTYYAPVPGSFDRVLAAACDFATNETDENTHIMPSVGYGYGQQICICLMWHTKGEENSKSLQRFTSIQPQIEQMNTMRTSTHIAMCDELSAFTKDGVRTFYATCTIKPDVPLMSAFHNKWQETLTSLKEVEGFTFAFGFQPLTKTLLQNSVDAGGNAQDLSPADGPLFIVLLNPTWANASDDKRVSTGVTKLLEEFKRLASQKGLLHRYLFTNYAYKTEDVFKGYGEKSWANLKAVSKKYDPEGIFQKGVPGGFKLSDST